jgi:hypothetical protein
MQYVHQMIFFVLSKLTDTITIGYFTGDIVNGSKVLLEIILNSNKSWKVLIRGKTGEIPYCNGVCKF